MARGTDALVKSGNSFAFAGCLIYDAIGTVRCFVSSAEISWRTDWCAAYPFSCLERLPASELTATPWQLSSSVVKR